jgi:hypothetical protein
MQLQVKDAYTERPAPEQAIANLGRGISLEVELDTMLSTLIHIYEESPDVIIKTCMAIMGRCTEMHVSLVRVEGQDRKAKYFRTAQLQRVMELCEFQFKGASRLVEIARQEVELSR